MMMNEKTETKGLPAEEAESRFETKSMYIGELARLYAPDIAEGSAVKRLKEWFAFTPGLLGSLQKAGYRNGIRSLTPKMVDLVVAFLGDP